MTKLITAMTRQLEFNVAKDVKDFKMLACAVRSMLRSTSIHVQGTPWASERKRSRRAMMLNSYYVDSSAISKTGRAANRHGTLGRAKLPRLPLHS